MILICKYNATLLAFDSSIPTGIPKHSEAHHVQQQEICLGKHETLNQVK